MTPISIGMPSADPRLNRKDAAEYLGVSVPTLEGWASKGGGPAYCKMGRRVVYLRSDLDAFIQSRRVAFAAQLSASPN
jgi:excisionase family DNA binding protein